MKKGKVRTNSSGDIVQGHRPNQAMGFCERPLRKTEFGEGSSLPYDQRTNILSETHGEPMTVLPTQTTNVQSPLRVQDANAHRDFSLMVGMPPLGEMSSSSNVKSKHMVHFQPNLLVNATKP